MDIKDNFNYPEATKRLIDYYYDQCPGSIMPLFLLYLARTSKPGEERIQIEEKIRKPLDWKTEPDQKYCSPILSQFTQEDAAELAKTDPAGTHLLDRWRCNEMDHMSIVVLHNGTRLKEIREAFQKHDEALGDSMLKRRALFLFVQGLLKCPKEFLKDCYVDIANDILKHASVFTEFDDISLARFERWILGNIKGPVFVPFARAPFAASMLSSASVSSESSGPAAELASMVSELIIKGNGIKKATSVSVAKPYESLGDIKYDGVVLNYASHDEKTDYTSWHTCLKQIKDNLSEKAKYVGLIETKYLFRMVGKQKLFGKIVSDCSLEAVILLPRKYGMALISVNKAKKHPKNVKMVNLYNEDLECPPRFFQQLVLHNSKTVSIDTLNKGQTKIESFFEETIPELDGFKVVALGKYLKRIRKESLFGVSDSTNPDDISVIHINREKPYSPYDFMAESRSIDSFSIYEPTYYLDTDALLVNEYGNLDARLYRGNAEPAVFFDGLAFAVSSRMWPPYLINELRKPYVLAQLNHWSTSKDKRHSEDEILDLRIYVPEENNPIEKEKDICRKELDENTLPNGFEVGDEFGNYYTIEECLGKGGFGISYQATKDSYWNFDVEPKTVVLKEFFGRLDDGSVRFDDVRVAMSLGSIESIRQETDLHSYLVKFIDEAETMKLFSRFKGSRIREARNLFLCRKTNTYYYEMDYYSRGTLRDELNTYGPMTEPEFIERVMKPVSVALDTMHNNRWLHLDIKAPNIIIDDEGMAILGDLGISQHYDEEGKRITKGGDVGTQGLCARQQYDLMFVSQFHPELDVYSFAGMMYLTLSGMDDLDGFSPDDLDSPFIELTDQTKEALRIALDPDLKTTPKSVRDFMHMLPGCEDMVFEDILPIEEDPDLDSSDFDPEELEDLPDFT